MKNIKIKKTALLLSIILSCILLPVIGCGNTSTESSMYITAAELTEEEENIANLLGLDTEQHLFDFVLDDSIQAIQINTYRLDGDEWDLIAGGGGQAFSDTTGRLALSFHVVGEGLRTAIQSENTEGSSTYTTESSDSFEGMARVTSFLSDPAEIVYEQEIPLAIQIISSKNEIHSYMVEYFHTPEEYAKYAYEYVYAITIRFSTKTVNELSISPTV